MKLWLLALLTASHSLFAADTKTAAAAVNQLGVNLYKQLAVGDGNLCISPYSIQSALAMTYAGADGTTKTEMRKVLNYPISDEVLNASQGELRNALNETLVKSAVVARNAEEPSKPITMHIANRLFGQSGYSFRTAYLELVKNRFAAPVEFLDFKANPASATRHINQWAASNTKGKIRDLLTDDVITTYTRLVLVNAIYLNAPWDSPFKKEETSDQPFYLQDGSSSAVPTMTQRLAAGYENEFGFRVVGLPCIGSELQVLLIIPKAKKGLRSVERRLKPKHLAKYAKLPRREIDLYLPKVKMEPASVKLKDSLMKLGIKKAFDEPPGSADFSAMAERGVDGYLKLDDVFHKTFLAFDESGAEAAAATAVLASTKGVEESPSEVRVDRPFMFAIQHVPSGACLFLGRVIDPR